MKIKRILIISNIILLIMSGIGCTEDNSGTIEKQGAEIESIKQELEEQKQEAKEEQRKTEIEEQKKADELIDDFKKRINTIDQNIESLNSKIDSWDSAYSMAMADNDINYNEINQLAELADTYKEQCEYAVPRMEEFKTFLTTNEQDLKGSEIDSYKEKIEISDDIVTIKRNSEKMNSDIEYLTQIMEELELSKWYELYEWEDESITYTTDSYIPTYEDYTEYLVLEDGYIHGYPLDYYGEVTDIEISSDIEINIYIMASEADYYKWISEETYEHYTSYEAYEVYYYYRSIDVYDDAYLIVENPSTFEIGDSANIEIIFTVEY